MKLSTTTWLIAALASCSGSSTQEPDIGSSNGATNIAIVNVNIVPMDRERVIESQTVLIDNGRITAIGASGSLQPPAGAFVIDGNDGYLLPGLIDMHVHIRTRELEDYLRGGITTVRNMWGYDELGAIVQDVESGARLGPRIFSLTAGFDASPPNWPQTQISDDVTAIGPLIDRQYNLGYREVKVYQKLSVAAYDTVVAIARRKGMTFAGHMPSQVGLARVLASGQRSIEHLGGYTPGSQLAGQAAATASAGTYNCPTLAILTLLNTPDFAASRRTIVSALHAAGAKLLVGTDAGIDRTAAGSSIHDELELFVQSGLSPFEALSGATRTASEYLGQTSSIGTIATGMEADLLLLRSNPLRNIGATRDMRAIIVNGKLLE
jgi:imidazolonepropionase-like amidohydrolase